MRHFVYLALLSGCLVGGGTRTVTALELRASVAGYRLNQIDPALRNALANGAIWDGASETELYISRGQPHLWWNTQINGSACRIFVHHGANPANADLAVTTCNGRVVGTNAIEPALPCWRLSEVGPRIAAANDYFESRPLDTQWQIVIGLLHRGQSERDVKIAFGEPHSNGFDEREDGKRAEKIVFLDRSGDAYGLAVTFIQDGVVSWQMPATRVLTPEAQQRRLDAMEKRLNTRIAELEAKQAAQHAETLKMFNQVMSRQDEMMKRLTAPPTPSLSRQLIAAAASEGLRHVAAEFARDADSDEVEGPTFRPLYGSSAPTTPNTLNVMKEVSSRPSDDDYVDGVGMDGKQHKFYKHGTCTCLGWLPGTPEKLMKGERREKCEKLDFPSGGNSLEVSQSCNTGCMAQGYGGGHSRFPDRCD